MPGDIWKKKPKNFLFSHTIHTIFPTDLFSEELDKWKGFLLVKDKKSKLGLPPLKGDFK